MNSTKCSAVTESNSGDVNTLQPLLLAYVVVCAQQAVRNQPTGWGWGSLCMVVQNQLTGWGEVGLLPTRAVGTRFNLNYEPKTTRLTFTLHKLSCV